MNFTLALLIGSAVAAPGFELFKRAACNAGMETAILGAPNAGGLTFFNRQLLARRESDQRFSLSFISDR